MSLKSSDLFIGIFTKNASEYLKKVEAIYNEEYTDLALELDEDGPRLTEITFYKDDAPDAHYAAADDDGHAAYGFGSFGGGFDEVEPIGKSERVFEKIKALFDVDEQPALKLIWDDVIEITFDDDGVTFSTIDYSDRDEDSEDDEDPIH